MILDRGEICRHAQNDSTIYLPNVIQKCLFRLGGNTFLKLKLYYFYAINTLSPSSF